MEDPVSTDAVDPVEELKGVTEEEKKFAENLEKFVIVEEILAQWEAPERQPNGDLCSVEELFEIVEEKFPETFADPVALHSFITARPHLFALTQFDRVRVRIDEDRRRYIEVVRFVREGKSVSCEAIVKQFWKEDWERMAKKMGEEEDGADQKWLERGPWRTSPVWQAIRRGGSGVFTVWPGGYISLTLRTEAERSFFDDAYLNFNEEVVRRLQKKLEEAEDDKEVRKQRQTNSTQVTMLAVIREAKAAYIRALCLSPNYMNESIYILPNQIEGKKNLNHHAGEMMLIRAHDVVGDENLKNRFRADDFLAFPHAALTQMMQPRPALSHEWRDDSVRKQFHFPHALRSHVVENGRESSASELNRLITEHNIEMELVHGEENELREAAVFSDFPIQTKTLVNEFVALAQYEELFVREMDNLIQCGVKRLKEQSEEVYSYPLEELLQDLRSRSITNPNCVPLIDGDTFEGLWEELAKRPHLYFIHDEDSSVSVYRLRDSFKKVLRLLDTQQRWTIESLTRALGEGKAGREWADEPVEDLLHALRFVIRREGGAFALAMRRTQEGVWMGDETADRRGTRRGEGRAIDAHEMWRDDPDADSDEEVEEKKEIKPEKMPEVREQKSVSERKPEIPTERAKLLEEVRMQMNLRREEDKRAEEQQVLAKTVEKVVIVKEKEQPIAYTSDEDEMTETDEDEDEDEEEEEVIGKNAVKKGRGAYGAREV